MTDKQKQEKLKLLDEQVLELLIKMTNTEDEEFDTNQITELSVAVNYLKSNSVVSEKEKSTLDDDIKRRLKEAQDRRKQNVSK